MNDSPVDCQSRDLARPQARRIPPSPPDESTTFQKNLKVVLFLLISPIYIGHTADIGGNSNDLLSG